MGHEGNVCALDVSPDAHDPYIISGSWDASARIWDLERGESKAVLEGHEGSVWAVLAFDKSTVITGQCITWFGNRLDQLVDIHH